MNTQQIGSLENLNIDPQTTIPENVALSGDAKNVRFNRSKKTGGYVLKEVDEYVINVIAPSLRWLQDRLETRDLEVHKLGTVCDELEAEKRKLLKELDAAHMNNMFKGAAQANSEDKEMAAIMDQNAALKAQVLDLEQRISSGGAVLSSGDIDPDIINQYEEAINAYQHNEQLYQTQINELSEQLTDLQNASNGDNQNLAETQKTIDELTEYANQAQPYIEELEAKIEELQVLASAPSGNPEREEELEASLAAANQEADKLRAQLENTVSSDDYQALQEYAGALVSPEDYEAVKAELASVQESHESAAASSNGELSAIKAELEEANKTVAELTEYANQAQPYIESLETDLEAAKSASDTSELEASLAEATTSANEHYENSVQLQQHIETLQEQNQLLQKQYKEETESLTNQLNEASDLANQYYEYSNQLQEQIGQETSISEADSLINKRNEELSDELDQLKADHEKLAKDYAQLYTAYEEYEKQIPEEGVVSANDYSALQVAFDELQDAKEEADKLARTAQSELDKLKSGFLNEGITVQEFEKLKKDYEAAVNELNETNMKYDTLRKKRAEESSANTPEGYYSAEEYEIIHEQLVNATDLYNNLVDEFEIVVNENNKLKQNTSTAQQKPVAPTAQEQEPEKSGEIYNGKALPKGLTLEDLE